MRRLFDTSKHCEMSLAVISDTRYEACVDHDFQLKKANLKRRNNHFTRIKLPSQERRFERKSTFKTLNIYRAFVLN